MDNQETKSQVNLKSAMLNIMGLIALLEDDHINESIRSDLVSVRDKIQRQIDALATIEETRSAFTDSTPIAPIPPKKLENTYRIEEEVTSGWVRIGKETENLTREKASEVYQNLINRESYNPDRLRIVVDGQV